MSQNTKQSQHKKHNPPASADFFLCIAETETRPREVVYFRLKRSFAAEQPYACLRRCVPERGEKGAKGNYQVDEKSCSVHGRTEEVSSLRSLVTETKAIDLL